MNRVPEPVTVKQRVHLDVHAATIDDVLALGATPEDLDQLPLEGRPGPRGWRAVRVRARDRARRPALRDRGRRRRPRADRPVVGRRPRRDVRHRRRGRLLVGRADPGSAVRGPRVRPGARAQDRQEPDPLGRRHVDTGVSTPSSPPAPSCCVSGTTRSSGRPRRPGGQRVLRVHSRGQAGGRRDLGGPPGGQQAGQQPGRSGDEHDQRELAPRQHHRRLVDGGPHQRLEGDPRERDARSACRARSRPPRAAPPPRPASGAADGGSGRARGAGRSRGHARAPTARACCRSRSGRSRRRSRAGRRRTR